MLLEFKCRNSASFKNEFTFTFEGVDAFKEHSETHLIPVKQDIARENFNLLKSAAIYGANASGKSNLLYSVNGMLKIIFNNFRDSLQKDEERKQYYIPFLLDTDSLVKPTLFEATLVKDKTVFRYGFEIFEHTILKEYLYDVSSGKEILIFKRDTEKKSFIFDETLFAEATAFKDYINDNVLAISHLAQNNQPVSKTIVLLFQDINVISGLEGGHYSDYTMKLLKKDENFQRWSAMVLKHLGIGNITVDEENKQILTVRNIYDDNNIIAGTMDFPYTRESAGTQKFIEILGPIYDSLKFGKVLFIDELDSKLHHRLTKHLVELFHKGNKNKAQLVFSTHDIQLMDKEVLRRDQIWIAEKDRFGSSELFSLSDFKSDVVRKTSSFSKKYLEGEFGGIEDFEVTDEMEEVLYGGR